MWFDKAFISYMPDSKCRSVVFYWIWIDRIGNDYIHRRKGIRKKLLIWNAYLPTVIWIGDRINS